MPSFPDKIKIVLPKLLFTPQHAFDDESLSIRVTKIYMNIKNKLPPPSITFPSHHSYTAPFVQAVFPVNSVDLFERRQCGFVRKSTMWICEEVNNVDLFGSQQCGFVRKAAFQICEEGRIADLRGRQRPNIPSQNTLTFTATEQPIHKCWKTVFKKNGVKKRYNALTSLNLGEGPAKKTPFLSFFLMRS